MRNTAKYKRPALHLATPPLTPSSSIATQASQSIGADSRVVEDCQAAESVGLEATHFLLVHDVISSSYMSVDDLKSAFHAILSHQSIYPADSPIKGIFVRYQDQGNIVVACYDVRDALNIFRALHDDTALSIRQKSDRSSEETCTFLTIEKLVDYVNLPYDKIANIVESVNAVVLLGVEHMNPGDDAEVTPERIKTVRVTNQDLLSSILKSFGSVRESKNVSVAQPSPIVSFPLSEYFEVEFMDARDALDARTSLQGCQNLGMRFCVYTDNSFPANTTNIVPVSAVPFPIYADGPNVDAKHTAIHPPGVVSRTRQSLFDPDAHGVTPQSIMSAIAEERPSPAAFFRGNPSTRTEHPLSLVGASNDAQSELPLTAAVPRYESHSKPRLAIHTDVLAGPGFGSQSFSPEPPAMYHSLSPAQYYSSFSSPFLAPQSPSMYPYLSPSDDRHHYPPGPWPQYERSLGMPNGYSSPSMSPGSMEYWYSYPSGVSSSTNGVYYPPPPQQYTPPVSSVFSPQSENSKTQESFFEVDDTRTRMEALQISDDSMSTAPPTSTAPATSHHPLERNQLNPSKIESGEDTRTTVMIKNIPNKMSDKDLIAFIYKVCPNKIDFLYLRMDFNNGCNVGYAFVNFIGVEFLLKFAKAKLGQKWNLFSSEKVLQMSYANYQGKEACVEKFKNSCIMDEKESWRPKIFFSDGDQQGLPEEFPPPTHISRKSRGSSNRNLYLPPASPHRGNEFNRHRSISTVRHP